MTTSTGQRLVAHVALGVVSAMLLGACDALWALVASGIWSSVASVPLAAVVMTPVGVLLGVVAWTVDETLRRGAWPFLRSRFLGDESHKLWLVSLGLATVTLGFVLAPGQALYVRAASALQDEDFAARLSMFLWALELLALGFLTLLLATAVRACLAFAMRKLGVLSASRVQRASVFAWLLLCAGLVGAFMRLDADLLGPALVLPYSVLLGLALLLLRASPLHALVLRQAARRWFWPSLAALFVLAAPLGTLLRPWSSALAGSLGPARILDGLASLTDFDRDGQSSLFGGTDCAPFDAMRGPMSFDIPGNHLDEDCNGSDAWLDAKSTHAGSHRRPSAPLPSSLVQRYNVVLIVIDAFRADRLAMPEARRSLAPQLTRFGKESVRFTNAFSQGPSTRISFPSFLSGRWPGELHFMQLGGPVQMSPKDDTLAVWLGRAGYVTELVTTRWMVTHLWGIFHGYQQVVDIRNAEAGPVGPVYSGFSSTARAIEFVDRVGDGPKPFFLTAYYDGPHSPYADQSEFGVVARGKRPVDRYEAEIRLVDQQVGHLLDHLRMKPKVWDKTVVVIMADHGEEFGEHGGAFHDRTCFVESTHVPLIIRVPGLLPAVAPGRVGLVDVAPTLLALTGTRVGTKLDGQNILSADPALYAHTADARMLCTFFLDRNPAATLIQAVRDERWTYMHNFHSNESLLFDTQNDPREAHNVLQNQPAVATPLRALLANKAFKQASAKPKPVKVKRSPVPVRVTGH